jgi:hypothetical protein
MYLILVSISCVALKSMIRIWNYVSISYTPQATITSGLATGMLLTVSVTSNSSWFVLHFCQLRLEEPKYCAVICETVEISLVVIMETELFIYSGLSPPGWNFCCTKTKS